MRWKLSRQESDIYRCCFCCHVRTGTLILGIVLMIGLICMLSTVIASMIIPERMDQMMHISSNKPTTPSTSVLVSGRKNASSTLMDDDVTHDDDKFVEIVWCIGMLGICSMLVYGTISGRSGYLMPFFCAQVFLFCIISLYIIGYVSAIPDMKKWLEMQDSFPYKDYLMTMDSDFLMLVAVFIFGIILVVQAYFIGMVWSCYKYMTSYETSASRVRSYGDDSMTTDADTEMLLPPKYEDVLRMSAEEPAPPPYTADE